MFTRFSNPSDMVQHFFMPLQILRVLSLFLIVIIAASQYTQYSTHQVDWPGLLMLGDKQIFHFVSLAKKTVAFFSISLSIFRFLTCDLNFRISSCSGVSLPFPRKDWLCFRTRMKLRYGMLLWLHCRCSLVTCHSASFVAFFVNQP